MKEVKSFEDVQKVLENHHQQILSYKNRVADAHNKSNRASDRSNDVSREVNQLILAIDKWQTRINGELSAVKNKINEFNKLPWYRRIFKKI